jgi:regulator of RNase E activity RraA
MNDASLQRREELRSHLDTGALSDAMDALGIWSVVSPAIRHVGGPRRKFFGRAYTVAWGPVRKRSDIRAPMLDTWSAVKGFLAPEVRDGKGLVYVGGSVGEPIVRYALAGGLSSGHFDSIGMEAMVLGGAMRDIDDLTSRRLPIWAMSTSPADTQGNYAVTSVGHECFVGDVRVRTGDWVFGDMTGVVVIPQESVDEVIRRALAIVEVEAAMQRELENGANLLEILGRSGHI